MSHTTDTDRTIGRRSISSRGSTTRTECRKFFLCAHGREEPPNDQRDDELGSDHDPERAHACVYSILGALQAQRSALDRSRPPPLHQQAAAANSDSDAVCYEREGAGANDLYADASTPAAASIVCESKLDQLGASAFQLRFPL